MTKYIVTILKKKFKKDRCTINVSLYIFLTLSHTHTHTHTHKQKFNDNVLFI
jgi:hypothetical protein